jgi:hypothetical protein
MRWRQAHKVRQHDDGTSIEFVKKIDINHKIDIITILRKFDHFIDN